MTEQAQRDQTVIRSATRGDRVMVALRLRTSGLAVIAALARDEGVTRSEMIRRLLSEAITARRQVT